jgi:hypothetical protein
MPMYFEVDPTSAGAKSVLVNVEFGPKNPFSLYQNANVFFSASNAAGTPAQAGSTAIQAGIQPACFVFQADYCEQGKSCLHSDPIIIVGDNDGRRPR